MRAWASTVSMSAVFSISLWSACGGVVDAADGDAGVSGGGAGGAASPRDGASTGGAGGVGSGGSGGTGPGGSVGTGGGPTGADLGSECSTDADCGGGLECVTSSSGALDGEGPAGGLCTRPCTGDIDDCIDLGGECLAFGADLYCFEACEYGPRQLMRFSPSKCHGRAEVACSPHQNAAGINVPACMPLCNSDADCGGLFCNPKTGNCSERAPSGDAIGASCDVSNDTCRGVCVEFPLAMGGTTSQCFEPCTVGAGNLGLASCGWSGPGSGVAPGFCLFTVQSVLVGGGPGYGDRGECAELCDCNAECANADQVCADLDNTQFTQGTGRRGFCSDPIDRMGDPVDQLVACDE